MKKVTVFRTDGEQVMKVSIVAPEGVDMVFDPSLLQHGVLSIGEYGSSGVKVAAFNRWDQALFIDPDGQGYKIDAKRV